MPADAPVALITLLRATPSDLTVSWTAEIEWYRTARGAAFRVAGRSATGSTLTLGVSQEFEWPLRDPHAVEEVVDAVEELEAALLAAGWAPLGPGAGWYAKRFHGSVGHAPRTAEDMQRPRLRLAAEPNAG